ncbi:metal ABC transporter ATP-binding protein [Fundidesulfovibrio putealis]|uniref:metal ABC transporter ATP-binding protein n=1 Tax=Fundidesulfovibrio putealis TaxID=270496 RepID=UPI0004151096|nr:ABC transporter ATP-binding protein [Fundidesulfovibrio putealis]
MNAVASGSLGHPVAALHSVRILRRGILALDIEHLEIAEGECLGVIGPNGAGKSTLLAALAGLLRPDSGHIEFFGKALDSASATALRKRVATVAQLAAVDPRLPITVLESVMTGGFGRLGLWKRAGRELAAKATQMLELTGIAHLSDRPLGLVSGGERQRTAVARALTQEPDILLLDEPTSALDWKSQREVLALIRDIHARLGLTVVLVTHDLNALPGMCDRVAYIQGGAISWLGPSAEALDPERLSELYGTTFTVLDHGGLPVVLF